MWRWFFHHSHQVFFSESPSSSRVTFKKRQETFHKQLFFYKIAETKQLIAMVPDLDQSDIILLTILLTILAIMIGAFAFVAIKSCLLSCTRNYVPPQEHMPTNLINLAIQCERSTNRPMRRQNQRQDRIFEV